MVIRPITPPDQAIAKALILQGMAERWGVVDHSLNPDIKNIADFYRDHHFFVGKLDGEMVATGALLNEAVGEGRIVRVSIDNRFRRMGFGRMMSHFLIEKSRQLNHHTLHVETTSTWHSAIQLYVNCGFKITHEADGETHMIMKL